MTATSEQDGVEVEVEGYDDRYLRVWPVEEAPTWATEALGPDMGPGLHYIMFVPTACKKTETPFITARTPDDWWAMLLCPAGLECAVKSVDEDGAFVLGLVRT